MDVNLMGPGFCAEIRDVGLAEVAEHDAAYAEVRAAFETYSVLLFRRQSITDALQVAFSRRFGPLEVAKAASLGEGTPFGIAAAVGFALSMITTKRLLRGDNAFTILFWMQGLQVLIGLAAAYGGALVGYGHGLVIPDLVTLAWLAGVGIFGLTAHYSLAKAFTFADAIIVAPMDFLRLPLIATVGVLMYAEPLDFWVLGGGIVVVVANLLNILGERRRAGGSRPS